MKPTLSRSQILRRRTLKIHGTFLLFIGVILTGVASYARITGTGFLGFLHDNPMALVGLFQAYLLMSLMGFVLLLGSSNTESSKWNFVGALAHIPPLAANLVFFQLFNAMSAGQVSIASIAMHTLWIIVELFAALKKE